MEKLPLLALAAASCVVTLSAQGVAIIEFDKLSLDQRVANAVVSLAAYLGQFFYPNPARLAVFYPYPDSLPLWEVAGALAILALVSVGVILARRKYPFLIVGWLWYLGMMVPVIGLVQVGLQAMADRYTYLPMIGVTIALVWFLASLAELWPWGRMALGIAGPLAVVVLMGCAWLQTSYWRNSETLWTHVLKCNPRSPLAHVNLGRWWTDQGKPDLALKEYRAALDIDPNYILALNNLAFTLFQRGEIDASIDACQKVLERNPRNSKAHNNLGLALQRRGDLDAAMSHYQLAVDCDPENAQAHHNLATLLHRRGKIDEAIDQYGLAIRANPRYFNAHAHLGQLFQEQGRLDEAIEEFQKALALHPDNDETPPQTRSGHLRSGHLRQAAEAGRIGRIFVEPTPARRFHPSMRKSCNSFLRNDLRLQQLGLQPGVENGTVRHLFIVREFSSMSRFGPIPLLIWCVAALLPSVRADAQVTPSPPLMMVPSDSTVPPPDGAFQRFHRPDRTRSATAILCRRRRTSARRRAMVQRKDPSRGNSCPMG